MSAYNVTRTLADKAGGIDKKFGTPLAVGAAIGGIIGNRLFMLLKEASGNLGMVGASQSIFLLALTIGTLIYTVKKSKILTKNTKV